MIVRKEINEDIDVIYLLQRTAFESADEALLVDNLRENCPYTLSLVAEDKNKVLGHIFFSRINFSKDPNFAMVALAPVAVLPEFRNDGVASALIKKAIEILTQEGQKAIFVLGEPDFYAKFGFVPTSYYQINCPFDVPKEFFMLLELEEDALSSFAGETPIYHKAFDALS